MLTGLIKTNIPGRISFKVSSKVDSQIILDTKGAERLLARGDLLFLQPGVGTPQRHHGPYLREEEVKAVTSFWEEQSGPEFAPELDEENSSVASMSLQTAHGMDKDKMHDEVLAYIASLKEVSVSLIQRRFKLGYPRAARLIETFEAAGFVGPAHNSRPREVLINK